MKKALITLLTLGISINTIAQRTTVQDSTCDFLKGITFKNGVDTVEFRATYDAFLESSDEAFLRILSDERKLKYSEYVDQYESNSLSFIPSNCNKLYQGTLSRKVYDTTFVRRTKDIREYIKEIVNVDSLKIGQIIYLKCIVFEDKRVYFHRYFFTIIDVKLAND